jgi:glycosyltransferase involved in cell wall biosynthesis
MKTPGSPFCIPFPKFTRIGGPTTFMKNLQKYLDEQDFSYVTNPRKANSIFFPVFFSKRVLEKIKKKGGVIIQRLDGIFYPEKNFDKYEELNKDIKDVYQNYADFIIFQSDHSRDQCFSMFGKKNKDQHTIIINGVDKSIFYPEKESPRGLKKKIKFAATGNFRNFDMIEPIIQALDLLQNQIHFELFLFGPIKNKLLMPYLKRDYVTHSIAADPVDLASHLRNMDIFIYSFLNPPCPNSVLEAISCALPVVGFDSGSMSELLFFSRELLAPVNEEVFQKYQDFDPEKLAEKIITSVENFSLYKQKAVDNSSRYSFEECGKKYMDVFLNT